MSNANNEIQKIEEGRDGVERIEERPEFTPAVDIYETQGAYGLVADLPGVDDKSLEITLERNVLTISGTAASVPREGYRCVHREFEHGGYRRSFQLTQEVDSSKISAALKDGVLRVSAAKQTPERRTIAVSAD
jgi:HSP20 family molecular chaperone IbpA